MLSKGKDVLPETVETVSALTVLGLNLDSKLYDFDKSCTFFESVSSSWKVEIMITSLQGFCEVELWILSTWVWGGILSKLKEEPLWVSPGWVGHSWRCRVHIAELASPTTFAEGWGSVTIMSRGAKPPIQRHLDRILPAKGPRQGGQAAVLGQEDVPSGCGWGQLHELQGGQRSWLAVKSSFSGGKFDKVGRERRFLGGACWGRRYWEGKIKLSSVFTPTGLLPFFSSSLPFSFLSFHPFFFIDLWFLHHKIHPSK